MRGGDVDELTPSAPDEPATIEAPSATVSPEEDGGGGRAAGCGSERSEASLRGGGGSSRCMQRIEPS